jgi:hypothetical protein
MSVTFYVPIEEKAGHIDALGVTGFGSHQRTATRGRESGE